MSLGADAKVLVGLTVPHLQAMATALLTSLHPCGARNTDALIRPAVGQRVLTERVCLRKCR